MCAMQQTIVDTVRKYTYDQTLNSLPKLSHTYKMYSTHLLN